MENISVLSGGYQLLTSRPSERSGSDVVDLKAEQVPESIVDLSVDVLSGIIEQINRTIGDQEHTISTDTGWFQKYHNDGSLIRDEAQSYGLAFNLMGHFCYYMQLAWRKGKTALPVGVLNYLAEMAKDNPGLMRREPKRICKTCKATF